MKRLRDWEFKRERGNFTNKAIPLISLQEFPSVREKEKGLKPQFHCPCTRTIYLFKGNISNGGGVWKWVPKDMSKFQDNPTVNEFGIVVLLIHVWVYVGKR